MASPAQSWPEPVVKFAEAISKAEGFGVAGAVPTSYNNPGDLTGADRGAFPVVGCNAEGIWHFVNVEDGWQSLYVKVARMLSGRSRIYPLEFTIEQVGLTYAHGDPSWGRNVAAALGVEPTLTLAEWVAENPL